MQELEVLAASFYLRSEVVQIAKELLGKVLVTHFNGETTSGRIVETEAYEGEIDKASHAYRGRTKRTEVMYGSGGVAYVYLCYGIHQMFNIVTNAEGTPHAILIRAVEPLEGVDVMLWRTGKKILDYTLTKGPGNVGKAFGFHTSQCGLPLTGPEILIADDGYVVKKKDIVLAPRIGVAYAGEHSEWLYRYYLKGNPWVSGKVKGNS
jgi:DNA-3-methyladenine glycosylase